MARTDLACIDALQRFLISGIQNGALALPQTQTFHSFADGMYARVCSRPQGTLLVGKVHKREHFYIVTKGRVQVDSGLGFHIHTAGDVIVSQPGTKRAVLALEDSVCMTVHRTDKTDLDEIEAELLEPDESALYDARNELKDKK